MTQQAGILYLVPTPIGNLEDISPRACRILASVDLIAAEDTRVTAQLLRALHLPAVELLSYHDHNARAREARLIAELGRGKKIAQVSDAGMPAISDPGEGLVRAALEAGFPVIALPGPNAALTALSASGISSRYFYFEGFIPAGGKERKTELEFLADFPDTLLIYEAPHRLTRTLADLMERGLGKRRLCLARELTKTYETYLYLTVEAALKHVEAEPPRGEYVLVLEGKMEFLQRCPEARAAADRELEAALFRDIQWLLAAGLSAKSISSFLQEHYACGKNLIYDLIKVSKQNES